LVGNGGGTPDEGGEQESCSKLVATAEIPSKPTSSQEWKKKKNVPNGKGGRCAGETDVLRPGSGNVENRKKICLGLIKNEIGPWVQLRGGGSQMKNYKKTENLSCNHKTATGA